jgi:hypothetical protein
MTRINCVPVAELTNKHLVAEYRELPRVFGLVKRAQDRGAKAHHYVWPESYTLGPGHLRFFYPRLLWCLFRQHSLVEEMKARGFMVRHDDPDQLAEGLRQEWFGGWAPMEADLELNRARLRARGAEAA